MVFKYIHGMCPDFLNRVLEAVPNTSTRFRNIFHKLRSPFRKIATGQISPSHISSSFRSKFPESLEKTCKTNTF